MSQGITPSKTIRRQAFSRVEVPVLAAVAIGFAIFGAPTLMRWMERRRATEAFEYLSSVRAAQERFLVQTGNYARDMKDLDMDKPTPTYFSVGGLVAGETGNLKDSWSMSLTRAGSGTFGAYSVTFTELGFDSAASTISKSVNPHGS